jgi:cupin superfamily acireductone dioxygenase involved in methionine salvage
VDGTALDNLVTTIGLSALTTAEVDQLENINSTVISSTQWGYLGAMDQSVIKGANVTFGNIIVTGTVDGRDISVDGTALDNLVTTIGLSALTTAEVDQLENINSTVISSTQWGYLGAMDQSVIKGANVTFGNIIVTGTVDSRDVSVDGTALDNLVTTIGLSALTTAEVDQLENINSTVISSTQWGYLGALDQDLATTSDIQFNTGVIDSTSTTALVVRKNNSGATVFRVDTSSGNIYLGASEFYAQETTNPLLNFDTNDYLAYDKTDNEYRFIIGGTSVFEINASEVLVNANKLNISGSISGAPSGVGKYLSVATSIYTDNTTTTSGTASIMVFNEFSAPTLSALNPSITTTDATTVYIGGAPIAGSNQTITNAYSLWVDSGNVRVDGNIIISGTVDGRDVSVDGTALDNLVTTIGLSALTSVEVDQLENINSTVISSTQWGYLGAMDQGITTTSDIQFNTGVIDSTSTTALVVRKNNSGATVFRVDTSSGNIYLGASEFYAKETTNPLLNFDTNDYLAYDKTENEYRFIIGGTSVFEINANEILVNANKLNISGSISGAPSGVGKYLSVPTSIYTDNTTTTSGTASIMVFNEFSAPTLSALNPSITTTDTATVYIGGAPIAGSNQTITNAYSLWVDSGNVRLDGNIIISGTVDSRDISVDGTALDNLVTTIGLSALTSVEVDQLENINSTVISSTQWGYLGAMDQSVIKGANVTFGSMIITDTAESTSITTGSLRVIGGVGIEKTLWTRNLNVGSASSVMGTCTFRSNIDCGLNISGSATSINIQSHDQGNSGGVGRDLSISGRDIGFITNDGSFLSTLINSTNTTFYKTVDSSSTTTGSIVVNGGVGIAKSLNVANINIKSTVESTSITTGALQVAGGIGISKSAYVGGTVIIDETNTKALSVRKDGDGGDILTVDTDIGKVKANVIQSNSGSISVTTGGTVLTTFRSKSGFITIGWGNGTRLCFFDWAEGLNTDTITSITTTSSSNNVTLALNYNNPNMEIVATSNTTLTVYWSVVYTGNGLT